MARRSPSFHGRAENSSPKGSPLAYVPPGTTFAGQRRLPGRVVVAFSGWVGGQQPLLDGHAAHHPEVVFGADRRREERRAHRLEVVGRRRRYRRGNAVEWHAVAGQDEGRHGEALAAQGVVLQERGVGPGLRAGRCRCRGRAARRSARREAHVGVAGAAERAATVGVAVGEIGHVRVPEDDGDGGLEFRDDGGVLGRHEFVAWPREAGPTRRGHLALDAGVGLDDDRHAPEPAARAGTGSAAAASCLAASASASSRYSVSIAP